MDEPERPQRGLTAEERGRDVSAAQAEVEAKEGRARRALGMMSPRFYFSQAEGYPLAIKWFLWFAMVWVYPVWIVVILLGLVLYAVLYAALWTLFLPVRMWVKRTNPEQYAKYSKKSA